MGDILKPKKSKMISIGSSKKIHVNDVGTPNLHSKHNVGIVEFAETNLGRAIVFDQHLIDCLYIHKYLDERQHGVCDKYLGIISKGTRLSSPQLEKVSTGKYYLAPIPRSCILINVQKHIRKSCGNKKESKFWLLMVNSPRKISEYDIDIVKDCANALTYYYSVSQTSPVSLFRQALLNPI